MFYVLFKSLLSAICRHLGDMKLACNLIRQSILFLCNDIQTEGTNQRLIRSFRIGIHNHGKQSTKNLRSLSSNSSTTASMISNITRLTACATMHFPRQWVSKWEMSIFLKFFLLIIEHHFYDSLYFISIECFFNKSLLDFFRQANESAETEFYVWWDNNFLGDFL